MTEMRQLPLSFDTSCSVQLRRPATGDTHGGKSLWRSSMAFEKLSGKSEWKPRLWPQRQLLILGKRQLSM